VCGVGRHLVAGHVSGHVSGLWPPGISLGTWQPLGRAMPNHLSLEAGAPWILLRYSERWEARSSALRNASCGTGGGVGNGLAGVRWGGGFVSPLAGWPEVTQVRVIGGYGGLPLGAHRCSLRLLSCTTPGTVHMFSPSVSYPMERSVMGRWRGISF
jgi:hypothetical protein